MILSRGARSCFRTKVCVHARGSQEYAQIKRGLYPKLKIACKKRWRNKVGHQTTQNPLSQFEGRQGLAFSSLHPRIGSFTWKHSGARLPKKHLTMGTETHLPHDEWWLMSDIARMRLHGCTQTQPPSLASGGCFWQQQQHLGRPRNVHCGGMTAALGEKWHVILVVSNSWWYFTRSNIGISWTFFLMPPLTCSTTNFWHRASLLVNRYLYAVFCHWSHGLGDRGTVRVISHIPTSAYNNH